MRYLRADKTTPSCREEPEGEATASGKSLARAGKMTGENIGFADPFVAKEAVGRLGVGPVLTCPWRGRTYSTRQLLQKLSQSLAMPNILKLASHHFIVYPFFRPEIRRRHPGLAYALTLSPVSSWQLLRHASSPKA